jgi:hypothetical protein
MVRATVRYCAGHGQISVDTTALFMGLQRTPSFPSRTTQYNGGVNRRFQIVISQPRPAGLGGSPPLGVWARFKLLFAGLAIVAVVVGVLIAALILGYIIAAIFCVVVLVVIAGLMIRSVFRRAGR